MKRLIAIGSVLLFASVASASSGVWGPEELKKAGAAAFEAFEAELSEEAYEGITAFTVKLRSQKNAATVKVTYEENGAVDTASFFCHTHGSTIDCH